MTPDLFVKYFHFIGIFGVIGALSIEAFAVKTTLPRWQVVRLTKVDAIYGVSSILVLATGFTMWFWVGKPAEFYGSNWIFYLKIIVFAIVGIASLYPTVYFMKNRKGDSEDTINIPPLIIWLIRLEVALMLTIPLMASMMARGIGN